MRRFIQRLKSIFKIARLLQVDDSGGLQHGKFEYMGTRASGQIFIPYGLMFHATEGSQMMVFAQGGMTTNAIALASHPRNRTLKELKPGEVAIGNYETGSYMLFRADGGISIVCKGDMGTVVDGDRTATVDGNQKTTITGNQDTTISGNQDTTISGNRSATITGNQDTTISGNRSATITGSDNQTAAGTIYNGGIRSRSIQLDSHVHAQGTDGGGDREKDTEGPK